MIADGTINVSPLIRVIISLEEAALAISSPPPKGEVRAIGVPNHGPKLNKGYFRDRQKKQKDKYFVNFRTIT